MAPDMRAGLVEWPGVWSVGCVDPEGVGAVAVNGEAQVVVCGAACAIPPAACGGHRVPDPAGPALRDGDSRALGVDPCPGVGVGVDEAVDHFAVGEQGAVVDARLGKPPPELTARVAEQRDIAVVAG